MHGFSTVSKHMPYLSLQLSQNECNEVIPKFPSRWGNLGITSTQKEGPPMVPENHGGPLLTYDHRAKRCVGNIYLLLCSYVIFQKRYFSTKSKLCEILPKLPHPTLSIVYEAMSKKEFEDLRSFTHIANNNALDMSDKFAKVRSLYYIMNKNLKQFIFSILFTLLANK